jgi:hypothetical protein
LEKLAAGKMGIVYKARQVSLSRVDSLRMILAGGFSSGREIRRIRTETETTANLDDLVPPTARPWLCGRHSTPAQQAVSRTQTISSTLAQRASVGSTEASRKSLRGSTHSYTLVTFDP